MLAVFLLLGLLAGLLVNYLADVLPGTRGLSTPLWWPLSGKSLRKYFSSARVLLVCLLYIAAAYALCDFPPPNFPTSVLALILIYFGVVAVIDIEHRLVLHPVSLAGGLLLGTIGLWRHGLVTTLLGAMVGFGIMVGFYFLGEGLGRWLARRRGEKWDQTALGFGDVNLATVIGLLMGYPGVVAALVLGVVAAGVYSLLLIILMLLRGRYSAFASIPYAPFLCLGAVVTVLLGLYAS